MRIFNCDHCRQLLFFENVQCVKCGRVLAYLPDLGVMGSLEPAGETPAGEREWRTPIPRAAGRTYRLCKNYSVHDVCNWAVDCKARRKADDDLSRVAGITAKQRKALKDRTRTLELTVWSLALYCTRLLTSVRGVGV